jgi:hypothetical protein
MWLAAIVCGPGSVIAKERLSLKTISPKKKSPRHHYENNIPKEHFLFCSRSQQRENMEDEDENMQPKNSEL